MYRFMYCKTINPLGEVGQYDFEELHDVINFCLNFRNKKCELYSAGYSVYELNPDGTIGKTLVNWQRDGNNIFGVLIDPNDRTVTFKP